MQLTRVRGMLLGVAGLFLALLGIFFVDNTAIVTVAGPAPTFVAPTPTVPPTPAVCQVAETPQYFANIKRAKERPWSFGPPATLSAYDRINGFVPIKSIRPETAKKELLRRLCLDPALYRAIMSVLDGSDPNRSLARKDWQRGVEDIARPGGALDFKFDRHRVFQATEAGNGYSMYMEPGKTRSDAPRIGASKLRRVSSWYYIVPVVANGKSVTLELRLDCGYQPRVTNRTQLPKALQAMV